MNSTRRTISACALALALVASGCGSSDDTATTTQPAAGDTSANAGSNDGGQTSDPNGEQALGGEPAGSAVMMVGDVTVEGEIVQCTLVEPDVTFVAQGETAQIEVASSGGGAVSVTVTGSYEFTGNGTASFDDGTTIDSGSVTIAGTGAQPDDSAPTEDFTVNATISSC